MLRHTFVTTMLDAGVSLRDVQIAARHADPKTTMRYAQARKNLDRHPNYILAAYAYGVVLDSGLRLFGELIDPIEARFSRPQSRRRVRDFMTGLLAPLPVKNCWTFAEHAGDDGWRDAGSTTTSGRKAGHPVADGARIVLGRPVRPHLVRLLPGGAAGVAGTLPAADVDHVVAGADQPRR